MAAPMSKLSSYICRSKVHGFRQFTPINLNTFATALSTSNTTSSKGFPEKGSRGPFVRRPKREAGQPRTHKMDLDQDWTAVYPAAAPFRQGSVPLPIRMGYPMNSGVPPEKKGNLELIKIPNFLHLTPEAVKKHCDALKPFCTEWPANLDSEDSCDELFPIKVESKNYVSAGTSIRNQSARTVELKVKLSSLNLDEHALKKMVKLVGERYCKETDILTISTNNCPLRQQNYDYSMYLLTALYHESWKTESWEADKTVEDMEEYSWEDSPSQKNVLDMLVCMQEAGQVAGKELLERPDVQEYRGSVIKLKNEGECEETMMQYKEAVRKLLKV